MEELLSKKDRVFFFTFYNKKKGRASECTALSLVVHALEVLRKGMMVQKMKLRTRFLSHKVIISLACSPCNGEKARVFVRRTTTGVWLRLRAVSFFSVRTVKQSAQDARTSPTEFMLESGLYSKRKQTICKREK